MRKPLPQSFPRSFRGEDPDAKTSPVQKYRAPSPFEQYKVLSIVFGILALGLAAYFIKSLLAAPHRPPPPVQSVYIEPLPQPAPSKAH